MNQTPFVVLTKTYFEPEQKQAVLTLAERSLPIFKAQKGFISLRFHISQDETHCMTYFEWESEEAHFACMDSEDWGPMREEWDQMFSKDSTRFELGTYKILDKP